MRARRSIVLRMVYRAVVGDVDDLEAERRFIHAVNGRTGVAPFVVKECRAVGDEELQIANLRRVDRRVDTPRSRSRQRSCTRRGWRSNRRCRPLPWRRGSSAAPDQDHWVLQISLSRSRSLHVSIIRGLRPSDSPTRSLARRFAGALRPSTCSGRPERSRGTFAWLTRCRSLALPVFVYRAVEFTR